MDDLFAPEYDDQFEEIEAERRARALANHRSPSVEKDDYNRPLAAAASSRAREYDDDEGFTAVRFASEGAAGGSGAVGGSSAAGGGPEEVVADLGIDQEVQVKQARRPQAKLDANRLLSAEGLLEIRRRAPRIKLKGKGHEYGDLGRIIECYRVWAHQLFPKAKFEDFLVLTEKVGRENQVKAARNAWMDEWKPSVPEPAEEQSDDLSEDSEAELNGPQRYDDGSGFVVDEQAVDDEDGFAAGVRGSGKRKRTNTQGSQNMFLSGGESEDEDFGAISKRINDNTRERAEEDGAVEGHAEAVAPAEAETAEEAQDQPVFVLEEGDKEDDEEQLAGAASQEESEGQIQMPFTLEPEDDSEMPDDSTQPAQPAQITEDPGYGDDDDDLYD
ncbi:replication fork protection component Swi3-domain-containing protein [Myxozyma melibiosi]|uniref:Chromosome segregation in meiosis protein n=1 Tax=Myxozyma melibiosi TaxID=54550 RepID=A0ABR1F6D1_9ASCO